MKRSHFVAATHSEYDALPKTSGPLRASLRPTLTARSWVCAGISMSTISRVVRRTPGASRLAAAVAVRGLRSTPAVGAQSAARSAPRATAFALSGTGDAPEVPRICAPPSPLCAPPPKRPLAKFGRSCKSAADLASFVPPALAQRPRRMRRPRRSFRPSSSPRSWTMAARSSSRRSARCLRLVTALPGASSWVPRTRRAS